MNPNFGGKAQTIVAGRVTPGPQGFPLLGQKVQRGDILVYVVSEATQTNKSLAETRLQRLRQLTDTVPRKVIDEAEAAVANEEVRSPVTGFIASSNVVSGQVVDSRETLFEIVDPARLLIEALTFDLSIANDIAHAYIKVADQSIPLNLIGVGRVMRGQAVPIVFSLSSIPSASLAIGQPVKVFAQNTQTVKAYRLPVTALMKNPANQNIVWIKKTPEQFEPRAVTVEPLDGANVAITSGLNDGELVVVRAATLINQIR
jgi:multidrug efflux pump subunit AcrA (membrane-fusion protein)